MPALRRKMLKMAWIVAAVKLPTFKYKGRPCGRSACVPGTFGLLSFSLRPPTQTAAPRDLQYASYRRSGRSSPSTELGEGRGCNQNRTKTAALLSPCPLCLSIPCPPAAPQSKAPAPARACVLCNYAKALYVRTYSSEIPAPTSTPAHGPRGTSHEWDTRGKGARARRSPRFCSTRSRARHRRSGGVEDEGRFYRTMATAQLSLAAAR